MDAKDFSIVDVPAFEPGKALKEMEELQAVLLSHYVMIENFDPPVWDMRLKKNQIEAKSFIFRVIEELGEAFESFVKGDETNFWTELADATHFLLELGIVTGVRMDPRVWKKVWATYTIPNPRLSERSIINWFWDVTYKLGLVSNSLRNKQWKQTEVLPDLRKFEKLMASTYDAFFSGFGDIGATEKDVFSWYWRKNQANLFRIKSKY